VQLVALGIGVAQFSIMRSVLRAGPVTATALGHLVDLDRSTVSRNIRVLERLRLVRLERGATDQRQMTITLTAKGRRVLDDGAPLWDRAQDDLRNQMGRAAGALLDIVNAA